MMDMNFKASNPQIQNSIFSLKLRSIPYFILIELQSSCSVQYNMSFVRYFYGKIQQKRAELDASLGVRNG